MFRLIVDLHHFMGFSAAYFFSGKLSEVEG